MEWKTLQVEESQLHLANTLLNGQCFNWSFDSKADHFQGVLQGHLVFLRRKSATAIEFRSQPASQKLQALLREYLNLEEDVAALYKKWGQAGLFTKAGLLYPGVRCLRQDPWQCTLSFICSQNNNIKRITSLVNKLRQTYGTPIPGTSTFAFPSLKQMGAVTEEQLQELGFGYRARYIVDSVEFIRKNGIEWLLGLRGKAHQLVRKQLMQLKGVGRKVADCIALFSLDCPEAVPVDTHVQQISEREGLVPGNRSLSQMHYDRIRRAFVTLFGDKAGWAHQILFLQDLGKEGKEQSKTAKGPADEQAPTLRKVR